MVFPFPPLLAITDRAQCASTLPAHIEAILQGGCRWVLYRDEHASQEEKKETGTALRTLTKNYQAHFFVSHDIELAQKLGADGVHLKSGQHINTKLNLLIGQSCHTEEDVIAAQKAGAQYVSLSPIFETASKPGYGPALGLNTLKKIAQNTAILVVALGGITASNAASCLGAGAKAVAVMGELMRATDPKAATQRLMNALKQGQ